MPGFLPESTAELATAGLVQRLQTVVAQASRATAVARSPTVRRWTTRIRAFPRVTVQVRLRCGAGEMAAVLHALESGTPRLFVDNLDILAQRYFFAPGSGGNQTGGLDVNSDLSVTFAPVSRPGSGGDGRPGKRRKTTGRDDSKRTIASLWTCCSAMVVYWAVPPALALAGMAAGSCQVAGRCPLLQSPPADPRAAGTTRPLVASTRKIRCACCSPPIVGRSRSCSAATRTPPTTSDYILSGVLLVPQVKLAMVQPSDGGDPERVKLGDAVEAAPAWRLVALEPAQRGVRGPGRAEDAGTARVFDGNGGEPPRRRQSPATRRPMARRRRTRPPPRSCAPGAGTGGLAR